MIPVETVPGIRGGRMKGNSEVVNSSMIYSIHFKNLCEYSNVPTQHSNKKKEQIKKTF
jgi:hypothetical protein